MLEINKNKNKNENEKLMNEILNVEKVCSFIEEKTLKIEVKNRSQNK